jgi:hypothetical protein
MDARIWFRNLMESKYLEDQRNGSNDNIKIELKDRLWRRLVKLAQDRVQSQVLLTSSLGVELYS